MGKSFLPFDEAKRVVQSLNVKTQKQFFQFFADRRFPEGVPRHPESVYKKDWTTWGDFLGTKWLPFAEARKVMRARGLKSQKEFDRLSKAGQLPNGIPSDPRRVYGAQFCGMGDFLGTGTVAPPEKVFLPFAEARKIVRAHRFKNRREFRRFIKEGRLPEGIPCCPEEVYKKKFRGMGDFLGNCTTHGIWNKNSLAAFLHDIRSLICLLSDADLYTLLQDAGLTVPLLRIFGTQKVAHVLKALRADDLEERIRGSKVADRDLNGRFDGELKQLDDIELDTKREVTPESLRTGDALLANRVSPEAVERLNTSNLVALRAMYLGEGRDAVEQLLAGDGGANFLRLRETFLDEILQVETLRVPQWKLCVHGLKTEPNRMQRYTAVRMIRGKYWCNWSGTGAGKTGSAGLSAFALRSKLTVVIANNSNLLQWKNELEDAFTGVHVFFDTKKVKRRAGCFLILNYEKFQNGTAQSLADEVVQLRPDLLVFDEVHLMKRRAKALSNRRSTLLEMRQKLNQTRVLLMTATPVINELSEGVSLLEVATGEPLPLKTRPSVDNALALHYELMRHGLRFRPNYEQELNVEQVKTQRDDLLDTLKREGHTVLKLEQILLPTKLTAVQKKIQSGTVIYLDYVKDMVPVVRRFVESLGLSAGEYTGETATEEREQVKRDFISGKIDVLIGSRPIGLGVDGLQHRCNRLIVLSLPWTAAAFEQLIGRVYRQGSKFKDVEVLLPQVLVSSYGKQWSWDEARLNLIEDKRTLSECAVDGTMPTCLSINQDEFLEQSLAALDKPTMQPDEEQVSPHLSQTSAFPRKSLRRISRNTIFSRRKSLGKRLRAFEDSSAPLSVSAIHVSQRGTLK